MTGVSVAASDGSAAAAASATASAVDLAGAGTFLGLMDRGEHDRAAKSLLGGGQPWIGQHGVSAGSQPADVHDRDHTCPQRVCHAGLGSSSGPIYQHFAEGTRHRVQPMCKSLNIRFRRE